MMPSARVVLFVLTVLALQVGYSPALARPHTHAGSASSSPGSGTVRQHTQHGHHSTTRSHARLCDRQFATPEQRRRCFCGKELAEAIREICRGRGYNEPDRGTGAGSGSGRGAADCCYRGCSYAELEQFCLPRSSPSSAESEAVSDSNPLEEAHQENHIRPVGNEEDYERNNETTDSPAAQMPTVVGGRTTSKHVNYTHLIPVRSDMVSVGTINTPRRSPVPMPVQQRWHGSSNALMS